MIGVNLSLREKRIFSLTVIIIGLIIVYVFIGEPLVKKWSNLNRDMVLKEAQFKKAVKLLENRNDIIRGYNNYAASVKSLPKILDYIEKKAMFLGVKISNIKPRPVIKMEFYKEYIIELQIEGTFQSFHKFVSHLIKPPIFISLRELNLRIEKENSSSFKGILVLSKIII